MPTMAFLVLDWLQRHPEATGSDKRRALNRVPAWQWAGEHWPELSRHCPDREAIPIPPRKGNVICIEYMGGADRCLLQPPVGIPARSNLAWFLSGGSVTAYGLCAKSRCPRCRESGKEVDLCADVL